MTTHLRREFLSLVMQTPAQQREHEFVSRDKAALFLGLSKRTLEDYAKKKVPPPPVGGFAGGEKGKRVLYRLSTLVDFLVKDAHAGDETFERLMTESEKSQSPGIPQLDPLSRAFFSRPVASQLLSDDPVGHCMAWGTTVVSVDSGEADFPFFVDEAGLVLGPAWNSAQQTSDWFISRKTDVLWRTWVQGLALVWSDESARLATIQNCAMNASTVPQLVADHRRQALLAL